MAKSTVNVVALPGIKIVTINDPAQELEIEPRNARFDIDQQRLADSELAGTDDAGNAVKYFWRSPVKDSDLIHCHEAQDGKRYVTDGNRRVATLKWLANNHPDAYREMLADLQQRDGGFRVAVYKGTLSETQILWALRDVDATQRPWTDAERLSHFRRLRRSGATVQQAAAFFGLQRWQDAERIDKLPDAVADLYIETRRDADAAKRNKDHTRVFSGILTTPQIAELSKLQSEFRKANPGSVASGPEFDAKLAEIRDGLTGAKATGFTPPPVSKTHRENLSPAIKALLDKGETLAARCLAIGLALELDADPAKITRALQKDDVTIFLADVAQL